MSKQIRKLRSIIYTVEMFVDTDFKQEVIEGALKELAATIQDYFPKTICEIKARKNYKEIRKIYAK